MAKYHKITGNESVGTIAGMYGVTPQTLLAANPGVSTLSAGAYLRVPSVQSATTQGVNWNGTNPLGGAGANQPKTPNPLDKVLNVFKGIGDTLGNIKFSPDSIYNQGSTQSATTPQPRRGTYGQTLPAVPPATPRANLNAQQIANQNEVVSSWKPSWATSTWNENMMKGTPTPVTPDIFQELVFVSQNNGLPRDASIQRVNGMLLSQGYVYNPITKRYDPGASANGTSGNVLDRNGNVVKDIAGNPVTTDGGKFSKDSWENYKQKTIARGGKRTWIGRGGNRGDGSTTTAPAATGSNVPNSTGNADSIWRIG